MDLPHAELLAPLPVLESLANVAPDATGVAVFGRAADLGALRRLERLERLWISGVAAAAARVVGELRGLRRLVIHDLRIADLSPLSGLAGLEQLAIAGSPRLKSLAGIERLAGLRSLILFDACGYTRVEPLAHLQALETLCLEGGRSKPLRLETLAPIGRLVGLRRLRLASLRVADGSLRPLHGLGALREVFVARTFGADELRRLAAALPEARGEFLDSSRDGGIQP